MSATNRGGERRKMDAYYTPLPLARALVKFLGQLPSGDVLEPSVGGGAWVTAIRDEAALQGVKIRIIGIDLDGKAEGLALCDVPIRFDFLNTCTPEYRPLLILGNPPYDAAEAHIRHAMELVAPGGTVAFLLRLAFLESAKRVPFWREHTPAVVYPIAERPSFTGGGTDSAAYGFFVWRPGHEVRGEQHTRLGMPPVMWRAQAEELAEAGAEGEGIMGDDSRCPSKPPRYWRVGDGCVLPRGHDVCQVRCKEHRATGHATHRLADGRRWPIGKENRS